MRLLLAFVDQFDVDTQARIRKAAETRNKDSVCFFPSGNTQARLEGLQRSIVNQLIQDNKAQKVGFGVLFHFGELAARQDATSLQGLFFPSMLFYCLNEASRTRQSLTLEEVQTSVSRLVTQEGPAFAIIEEIASRRNRSPFILPRRNFSSRELEPLLSNFSFNASNCASKVYFKRARERYLALGHPHVSDRGGFVDLRGLEFEPSEKEAMHGEVREENPTFCYLNGALRFGASILKGFHFDVTRPNGQISGSFTDCRGQALSISNASRLNVFPNDHIIEKA